MPSKPLSFRQRDMAAAIKVAKAAGLSIARIEVRQGGVDLIIGEPEKPKEDGFNPEREAIFEALRK